MCLSLNYIALLNKIQFRIRNTDYTLFQTACDSQQIFLSGSQRCPRKILLCPLRKPRSFPVALGSNFSQVNKVKRLDCPEKFYKRWNTGRPCLPVSGDDLLVPREATRTTRQLRKQVQGARAMEARSRC